MRNLFLIISIVLGFFAYVPAASADAGLDAWKAECKANGANHIYQVNGKWNCDDQPVTGGPINNTPAPETPVKHVATGNGVEAEFRADCAAHGGKVYSASEWNASGLGPQIRQGQLKCYAEAHWSVD